MLLASGSFDFGTPEAAYVINCLRPLLTAAGINFSLPNQGPIADAAASWILLEGGGERNAPRTAYLRLYGGNPSRQKTDAQGISRMGV